MINLYRLRYDYLKLEGTDRLDLINRLSTNEVKSLAKNKSVKTVLTSDKGRFIDLLWLHNFGDFVLVFCSFNNSQRVIEHLGKYTIMDDFKVTDMAGTHETILLDGDECESFIENKFNIDSSKLDSEFVIHTFGEMHSMFVKNDDALGKYIFTFESKDKEHWNTKFSGLTELTAEEFTAKRIENGLPAFPNEMNDSTNPLECNLEKYISFTKGCYIGQEVIARLDTYDKVSRHLVGVNAEEEFSFGENVKILTDNKECGYVTSYVHSANSGHIGLGFIKTAFLNSESVYHIKTNEKIINCKIISYNK